MNMTPNKTSSARMAFQGYASSLHWQSYMKQPPGTPQGCKLYEGSAWHGKHILHIL